MTCNVVGPALSQLARDDIWEQVYWKTNLPGHSTIKSGAVERWWSKSTDGEKKGGGCGVAVVLFAPASRCGGASDVMRNFLEKGTTASQIVQSQTMFDSYITWPLLETQYT